ncbi:DHA1 family chloramphenicol resistance protein-like MFS transporter [Nocardia sp. GAS34]|uniref:MFS transporter n=1 Tax=unclassified Nocardia TaxID=2637762 RepID=UPI003D1E0E0D
MPLAVYILGLSIFAQGTSELMLAGLLTEISSDLSVSVPQAGLLISGFAVGMLVGALILAVVTQRWSRRNALLAFLVVFVAAHVVAARGRAMGIVAGGLTVATVIGLPAGTFIGQHVGWRASFWAVAMLSVIAMVGVALCVPGERPGEVSAIRKELRASATAPVLLLYGTIALSTAALLVTFGYLGALLTETTRLPAVWVPVVLGLYGLGSLGGIVVGGRTADAHPMRSLVVGVAGVSVTSVLLALAAHPAVAVDVLVFLLGAFGFGTNPTLNSRVFALAPAAANLGAAGNDFCTLTW